MEEQIYSLLNSCLDSGLSEFTFWEMTISEITRHIESANRVRKQQAQERASSDYILASLIARGVAMSFDSKNTFPAITEVYPDLFNDLIEAQEEKIQKKKAELSALRFKQFAQSHNSNFKQREVQTTNE